MPGIIEPTGDNTTGKGAECVAAKPVFKQRSNGKRSRVDVADSATDSDSSSRASIRSHALSMRKTARASSRIVPAVTAEEVDGDGDGDKKEDGDDHHHTRHNQVEKKYRNRLNDSFARLLAAVELTASDNDEGVDGEDRLRTLSKGNVLGLASKRLLALEAQNQLLSSEVRRLKDIIYV